MAASHVTSVTEFSNGTHRDVEETDGIDVMMILHSTTASVGIVANLTVVVAFLNHKKYRRKIPNVFIINQVSSFWGFFYFGLDILECAFLFWFRFLFLIWRT